MSVTYRCSHCSEEVTALDVAATATLCGENCCCIEDPEVVQYECQHCSASSTDHQDIVEVVDSGSGEDRYRVIGGIDPTFYGEYDTLDEADAAEPGIKVVWDTH